MTAAERARKTRNDLRERAWAIHGRICVVCGGVATQLAHVYPTDCVGRGRGMDRRYRDAIKNRENYVATCAAHNSQVDAVFARKAMARHVDKLEHPHWQPDDEKWAVPITLEDAKEMNAFIRAEGVPWSWLLNRFGVSRAGELTVGQAQKIIDGLPALGDECRAEGAAVAPVIDYVADRREWHK